MCRVSTSCYHIVHIRVCVKIKFLPIGNYVLPIFVLKRRYVQILYSFKYTSIICMDISLPNCDGKQYRNPHYNMCPCLYAHSVLNEFCLFANFWFSLNRTWIVPLKKKKPSLLPTHSLSVLWYNLFVWYGGCACNQFQEHL